jgi:hypothetical protein
MADRPGSALGVASWAFAGCGVLLFIATALQGRPREGVDGLLAFGGQVILGGVAFLFVIVGIICGAMSVSAAAAAGDRRGRIGLPLLLNIVALLGFIAFLLSSRP